MVTFDPIDRYLPQRQRMIDRDLRGRDITDPRVLDAMHQVPRELFVSADYAACAYDDNPLPIGMGQTISQPYIVALMTQLLALNGQGDVLEIGTGCGYQTAVLAGLCRRVYTIERFGELSAGAQTVLESLGIKNVEFFVGDGSRGWPQERTFDRILITAAVRLPPEPLTRQLKDDGILVAPIGEPGYQTLTVYRKRGDDWIEQSVCGCRFVKLVGQFGFPSE